MDINLRLAVFQDKPAVGPAVHDDGSGFPAAVDVNGFPPRFPKPRGCGLLGAVNRIRLLPEQVANQIAAGEVVERPASVVKELVENALDAEAGRIVVEIAAGGSSLIRVTDDGFGMSRDDALLCLERHATSKIRRAEDLSAIATLGFRGEALPSIASVSRFSLTTRERGDASGEGSQVLIHGGRMVHVKAAASPEGTAIEVRQLFFNLPARRKFLRSEETERAHIAHYLTLVALAHPQVGLSFISDGRPVWQLPPVRWHSAAERFAALRDRMLHWIGREVPLLPVEFTASIESRPDPGLRDEGPDADETLRLDAPSPSDAAPDRSRLRLWGFIGAPGVSRSSREEQHLFVNQRPVENRGLNFALLEGYHTALMKGRYPVCCLFLEVDPAAVDVNVHPQKREVKFREEAAIRRLTARAVREALLQFHGPVSAGTAAAAPPGTSVATGGVPPAPAMPPAFRLDPTPPARSIAAQPVLPLSLRPDLRGPVPSAPEVPDPSGVSAEATLLRETPPPSPPAATPLLHVPLRLVGVVGRLYVVLESDRGLVLLDQHAAHERVLFEQMLARLQQDAQAPSQRLLLPETLELPPKDADFVRRNQDTLSRLGVGLSAFGERTFLLDALPPFVRAGDFRQFTTGLVDALKAAGSGVNNARLGEEVVAKTVCRHAVKARDPLGPAELENLVADLRRCEMPYTCPHGRPTLIEMNWRELEKKFGRTG